MGKFYGARFVIVLASCRSKFHSTPVPDGSCLLFPGIVKFL